jgi:hypothetical protein
MIRVKIFYLPRGDSSTRLVPADLYNPHMDLCASPIKRTFPDGTQRAISPLRVWPAFLGGAVLLYLESLNDSKT